jgi:chloramphenicol 3-O-phosphotransferase
MQPITVLTGPAASGKNSVAHVYATQFRERCAVIDGDLVRWMLRQPHAAPWDEPEGLAQHRLGARHASMLARSFVDEGYETLILDVLWADLPERYRRALDGCPLRIVRLMPTWEESLRRLHERPHSISDAEARWVYDAQMALRDFDYSLDNTNVPVEQAAAWLASLPGQRSGE